MQYFETKLRVCVAAAVLASGCAAEVQPRPAAEEKLIVSGPVVAATAKIVAFLNSPPGQLLLAAVGTFLGRELPNWIGSLISNITGQEENSALEQAIIRIGQSDMSEQQQKDVIGGLLSASENQNPAKQAVEVLLKADRLWADSRGPWFEAEIQDGIVLDATGRDDGNCNFSPSTDERIFRAALQCLVNNTTKEASLKRIGTLIWIAVEQYAAGTGHVQHLYGSEVMRGTLENMTISPNIAKHIYDLLNRPFICHLLKTKCPEIWTQ